MRHSIPVLFVTLALVVLAISACTLIHIEGDSNTVSDIEGHSATMSLPASTSAPTISQ
ncbi:hypothetical protein [Burkholderia sp. SRS-W-2-2016]|uniref:hypothetical protein n=1 Tax=Burkholderia sp. SRS-W-2-2016 TaxID=1926878 RepID=UPI000AF49CDF|nr:hypothetical protein [Burkholderia sp. SRS-W-2-2016]